MRQVESVALCYQLAHRFLTKHERTKKKNQEQTLGETSKVIVATNQGTESNSAPLDSIYTRLSEKRFHIEWFTV